jgi:arylsulfatase A-like enzyme
MIRDLHFYEDRPGFYVLNTGETHYPYATPDEHENDWPRIHGVNGVFKHLDDHLRAGQLVKTSDRWFDDAKMEELRQRQISAVRWVDRTIEELFDTVPPGTWITVTADHGDLFGEAGYFGHGPINHEKVIEVPFVEGVL